MTSPGGDSRQIKIVVAADVAAAIRGLTEVANAAGNLSGSAEQSAKKSTSAWDSFKESVAGQVAIGDLISKGVSGAFGLVVDGVKNMVQAGLEYEANMNTLRSVTGATDSQMRQLGDAAKQLGNDVTIPGASAATAAEAMKELAKGGLTVEAAMAAAAGTLQLAAAAQVSGGEAAEIQANALSAFRLKADQANHVADLLAGAANSASGEVTDMASALQQSATVAAGFGISIDDTTTTLALFARNGVLSSDAGTSLKTMLTSLASPSKEAAKAIDTLGLTIYTAQGTFVGMESLTDQLARAKQRLTVAEYNAAASTAFGTDAIRAANILGVEGVKGWNIMEAAVTKAGNAQDMASAQSQGLNGALDRVNNAVSTVGLSIFEHFAPAMESVVDFGAGVVGAVGDLVGVLDNVPGPVWAGTAALGAMIVLKGPLNALFIQAIAGYARMAIAVRSASFSFVGIAATAKAALAAIGGPFGLAVIGVTTALSFMGSATDEATSYTADFSEAIDENTGALKENAPAVVAKALADSGALDAAEKGSVAISDYTNAVVKQGPALDALRAQIADHAVELLKQGGNYEKVVQQAQRAKMGTDEYIVSLLGSADASRGADVGLSDLITVYSNLNRDSGQMETQQRQVGQALIAAGSSAGDTAGQMDTLNQRLQETTEKFDPYKAALDAARDAASDADNATTFLQGALERLAGGQVSAEQAMRENEAAFRGIASAQRDAAEANQRVAEKQADYDRIASHLGTTLDGQAVSSTNLAITQADVDKAARDLADAQSAVADAGDRQFDANLKAAQSASEMAAQAYNAKAAQGDFAGGIADATATMEAQRQKFIDTQIETGKSREEAEKLADKYGLIPGNVTTTFTQNGLEGALQQAKDLNAELDKANNRTIYYTAIGTSVVQYTAASQGKDAQGNVIGGGASSTDSYLLDKLYGGHADGGWVSGPGGPREDMVHARLSPGEFVVNAAQAGKHGGLLEAINSGAMGFADGGPVPGGDTAATAGAAVAVSAPDPGVFAAAWSAIAAAVQGAWTTVLLPVMDAMSARNVQAGAEITTLAATIQVQQSAVIQPTYDALNAGTAGVAAQQEMLRATWELVWQANLDKTTNVWAALGAVLFPAMTTGLVNLGVSQQALAATTDASWSQIGSKIQSTYDGQIVPAWNGVQSFAREVGSFFDGINTGAANAAATTAANIAEIQTEMTKFFDMVEGKVAANAPSGGSGVTVTPSAAMADGGPITVGTTGRADDVLIAVSKGEYVVNAKSAAAHRDTLDSINFGGKYADGGMVGSAIQPSMTTMLEQGFQSATEAVVTKALSAFPMGGGGSVVFNGNLIVDGATAPLPVGVRGEFLKAVASKMGTSYVWGAAGPDVFDCSGLMSWGLNSAGAGVGRLTAADFNHSFPHIGMPGKPGDLVTFDTGRIPGDAGHIGAILDPTKGLMMHTDGAGPARVGDYLSRDGGPLSVLDVLGGTAIPSPSDNAEAGDPPAGGWLGSILSKIKAGGTGVGASGSYSSTGGVEQWRDEVLFSLAFLGESSSLADTVLNQVRTESGGDPRAVNTWDKNFGLYGGSKGLVQVIPPTFATYAVAPYNQDIFDPISNLIAGENYARHAYGSIAAGMRGVAYDNGGILPPGFTMAYNGTGSNEAIFTGQQFNAMAAQAVQPVSITPRIEITNYVDAEGILSRTEVMIDGKLAEAGNRLFTMTGQSR